MSQLIEREFGVKLQTGSLGKYLTRWGFTPQKPIKQAMSEALPQYKLRWTSIRVLSSAPELKGGIH